MQDECASTIALVFAIYRDFGFDDVAVKLSTRPANRIGSDETWDQLEGALSGALDRMGMEYRINPGEGAFYGRSSNSCCATRSAATGNAARCRSTSTCPSASTSATSTNGANAKRPVMLHRALFGSLERFTGILIEHYSRPLPALAGAAAGRRTQHQRRSGRLRAKAC
jgi:threonyl-tRNA synthetase